MFLYFLLHRGDICFAVTNGLFKPTYMDLRKIVCKFESNRVENVGSVLPISTHLLSHLDDPLQVLRMYRSSLVPS